MSQRVGTQQRFSMKWFLNQVSGVGFIHLVSVPLGLVLGVALARALGPEKYGQYAFLISILTLLALPVVAGVSQLLTKEAANHKQSESWRLYAGLKRTAFIWIAIVSAFLVALISMLSTTKVAATFFSVGPAFWIGLILIPINGLLAAHNGFAKGLGYPALAEAPAKIFTQLLMLFAVFLLFSQKHISVSAVIMAQAIVGILTLAAAFIMLGSREPYDTRQPEPQYDFSNWRTVYIPLVFIGVTGTLNAQIPIVMLGALSTDIAVAALRVAERACQFVVMPLIVINTVLAPLAVGLFNNHEISKMQKIFKGASRGAFILSITIGLIFIAWGKVLIELCFGAEYVDIAYYPLVILTIGQLINVAAGPVGLVLMMCGQEKAALHSQLIGLSTTFFLAVALIPLFDHVGAAIAVTTGIIAWNTSMTIFVKSKLGISINII